MRFSLLKSTLLFSCIPKVSKIAFSTSALYSAALVNRANKESSKLRRLSFDNQKPLPVVYKGVEIDCGYKMDLVVKSAIVVELKSCEKIEPIHKAQLLTYLKLSDLNLGLLLNFNVPIMREGITRIVNNLEE